MILLRQRFYSDNNSEDNKKSNKAAKEAGMIAGSLGVGALGGVGIHQLAKHSDERREKAVERINKRLGKRYDKYFKKWNEAEGDTMKKLNAKMEKIQNRKDKVSKLSGKLEKVTKPVSEFAKTKGGKWALIGVPTAALGTGAYLEAKKRDKRK